mmetsp:Transcript_38163/g.98631  ORF Transcript_38163/g.98631 Transcript_38163/m.98631 type:complete len:857 (-) Transcript_38163:52-2622(-)
MARLVVCSLVCLLAAEIHEARAQPQPNPPQWPPSVQVFGPETDAAVITSAVNAAYTKNGGHKPTDHGQFSPARYAFLFKPGTYTVDVPIGYYTQVLGLGVQPGEVVFNAPRGPHSEEGDQSDMGGALSTFWRGAENFRTMTDKMLWAVSQAAPMRRIIADGDLNLAQYIGGLGMGYSSGGFVGNVKVKGTLFPGSQQQFCTRNAEVGKWSGGVWNMAFIGTEGAPAAHCGKKGGLPLVNVPSTPVIAEKPFISIGADGRYTLHVPAAKRDRVGADFEPGLAISFDQVYVAKDTDTAEAINAQLAKGLHVVLSAGVYSLDAPLKLDRDNQVLLGLGLATLVAEAGTPAVHVGNVDGVRVAGVLLQAGAQDSPSLLEWGDGSHPGNPQNPGFLHDVFARVGGPTDPAVEEVRAEVMVRVNSGHVIGDNLWLWRADHGVAGLTMNNMNPVRTGLVVTGDNVRMYGLAVEHTLEDQVRWSGNNGATYFFQSELPYDVTAEYGQAGWTGYHVMDNVQSHQAYGIGVYHFFRDHAVTVDHGIAAPAWLENSFTSPLSVYLTGKGKILHVLNALGGTSGKDIEQVQWSCEPAPRVPLPAVLPPRPSTPVDTPMAKQQPQAVALPAMPSMPAMPAWPWGAPAPHKGPQGPNGGVQVITDGTAPGADPNAQMIANGGAPGALQGQPAGQPAGGGGYFALNPVVKHLISVQLLLVAGLAAYLFRKRLRNASEEVVNALSPTGATGKRARFMHRTPGGGPKTPGQAHTLQMPSPSAASPELQPDMKGSDMWGLFNMLIGCVSQRGTQRSAFVTHTPAESPMRRRGFPGLSPGGPSARTLSANASPSFGMSGMSPFGRRSPPWRPEDV